MHPTTVAPSICPGIGLHYKMAEESCPKQHNTLQQDPNNPFGLESSSDLGTSVRSSREEARQTTSF